jgi:hypothetical protein
MQAPLRPGEVSDLPGEHGTSYTMMNKPRSIRRLAFALAAFALTSAGCSEAAPAATPLIPANRIVDNRRLRALQALENPAMLATVRAISRSGDPSARQDLAELVAQMVLEFHGEALRGRLRERLRVANAQFHLEPTLQQAEAQIDDYCGRLEFDVLDAMLEVGGARNVAYGLALAEDERRPRLIRRLALNVVERHGNPADQGLLYRRAAVAQRLAALAHEEERQRGGVSSAQAVVDSLKLGFNICYRDAQAADKTLARVEVRVVLGVDEAGAARNVTVEGSLPPEFARCLERVARSRARFDPLEGGHATVVVPITFVPGPRE